MKLSFEEIALVSVMDHSTKQACVNDIERFIPFCNSSEFKESLRVILKKFQTMTDEEFQKIDFMEDEEDGEQDEKQRDPALSVR